jgi:hypothetical protein
MWWDFKQHFVVQHVGDGDRRSRAAELSFVRRGARMTASLDFSCSSSLKFRCWRNFWLDMSALLKGWKIRVEISRD